MNNTNTIPAGSAVLGRVLNSNGEPIDGKGNLDAAVRVPLYTPGNAATTHDAPLTLLETGIKAIDLMAPIPHGGVISMVAGYGVGNLVVTEEIMHNLITRRDYAIVFAAMSETTFDASKLREMSREIEAEDRIAMVFEQATNALPARQRLLRAAMTIAASLRDEGRAALLVVDDDIISAENLDDLRDLQDFAAAKDITAIIFAAVNDADEPVDMNVLNELDGYIKLSRARAKQSLWPAVDPLASRSRLLESDAVSAEHRQVAQRVRKLLERYSELRENNATASPSEEEQPILGRGERVNLFFTQPFTVAEAYTELPGEYLTVEQTVNSFRDLLDGRYDAVPAQAFNFVGTIEQALAK